jgi:hypothetical protein
MIELTDALRHGMTVGYETRWPLRGFAIPSRQRIDDGTNEPIRDSPNPSRRKGAYVFIVIEQKAAHRVDEANVYRLRSKVHALGPRTRRADDCVVRRKIERLERARIEGSKITKILIRAGNAREVRDVHARAWHQVAGDMPIVQRGIDGRVGPSRSNMRENPFGASALVQVVVDESYLN